MKMEQVSNSCYAVLNEKNRVCDSNSGLPTQAGGAGHSCRNGAAYRL
jgi:cyclase